MIRWHRGMVAAAVAAAVWGATGSADDKAPAASAFRGTIRVEKPDGTVEEFKFADGEEAKMEAKLKELDESPHRVETTRIYGGGPIGDADGVPEVAAPMYGIGVSISSNVPKLLRTHLKLSEGEGLVIQSVADGSPAAKAGLKESDVVLQAGAAPIKSHQDLVDAVQAAGETMSPLSLKVISAGDRKTINVTPVKSDHIEWTFRNVDMLFGTPGLPLEGDPEFGAFFQTFGGQPPFGGQPGIPCPTDGGPAPTPAAEAHTIPLPPSGRPDLEQRIKGLEQQIQDLSRQLEARKKDAA